MSDFSKYDTQIFKFLSKTVDWQKNADTNSDSTLSRDEFVNYLEDETKINWGIKTPDNKSDILENFFNKFIETNDSNFIVNTDITEEDDKNASTNELENFNLRLKIFKDLNNYNIGNLNLGSALASDKYFTIYIEDRCKNYTEDNLKGLVNEYLKHVGITSISLESEDGTIAECPEAERDLFTTNNSLSTLQQQIAKARIYNNVAAKYLNTYIKYQDKFAKAVEDYVKSRVLSQLPVGSWENETIDWASLANGFDKSTEKINLETWIWDQEKPTTPTVDPTPPVYPTPTVDPTLYTSRAEQVIYDFRNTTSDDDTIAVGYREETRYVRYYVNDSGKVIFTDNDKYDKNGGVFDDPTDNAVMNDFAKLKKQLEKSYAKEIKDLDLDSETLTQLFNKTVFLVVSDAWNKPKEDALIDFDLVIKDIIKSYEVILFKLKDNVSAISWLSNAKDLNILAGQTMEKNSFSDYFTDNTSGGNNNIVSLVVNEKMSSQDSTYYEHSYNELTIYKFNCHNTDDTTALDNAMTKLYRDYLNKYGDILDKDTIAFLFSKAQFDAVCQDWCNVDNRKYCDSIADANNIGSKESGYRTIQDILIETMYHMEQELAEKILDFNLTFDTDWYIDNISYTKDSYNYKTTQVTDISNDIINNLENDGIRKIGKKVPAFFVSNTGEIIFVDYKEAGSVFNDKPLEALNSYVNDIQKHLENKYNSTIRELNLTSTELENLFNLALFLTLSDSTVVENQYAETDFDKIIEATIRNYSKMLVEVGKGQAARAYLTDTENNSLLAGRYTGITDEKEKEWLGNSMTRADGLDRNLDNDIYNEASTCGTDNETNLSVEKVDGKWQYKEAWSNGILSIASRNTTDTKVVDDAMYKLYKKYLNNYDGLISASRIKELYIQAQRNAFEALIPVYQTNDSTTGAKDVYGYSYTTVNGYWATKIDGLLNAQAILIQIMYEMERLLALEAFGL